MNARQKLNAAFLQGSLLVATIIGIYAESWLVFLVSLLLSVATAIYTGDIRLTPRR